MTGEDLPMTTRPGDDDLDRQTPSLDEDPALAELLASLDRETPRLLADLDRETAPLLASLDAEDPPRARPDRKRATDQESQVCNNGGGWADPTSREEACRRAGGRRHYDSVRRFGATWRRAQLARLFLARGWWRASGAACVDGRGRLG
jgi:hypothetical protein